MRIAPIRRPCGAPAVMPATCWPNRGPGTVGAADAAPTGSAVASSPAAVAGMMTFRNRRTVDSPHLGMMTSPCPHVGPRVNRAEAHVTGFRRR